MDTNEVIRQLTEERNRIDAAIKLLSGSAAPSKAPAKGKRKKMSAAARKRISEGTMGEGQEGEGMTTPSKTENIVDRLYTKGSDRIAFFVRPVGFPETPF